MASERPVLTAKAGFEPSGLPGLRKAAILMMSVGEETASLLLQGLGEKNVERVTAEVTRVGKVAPEELKQVAMEFYGLLETEQIFVQGGPEYAERMLTEAFGTERATAMLSQVRNMRERTTGDLAILQKMEPQQLAKFLENEHPQTIALVLAHLDPRQGSSVLMHLAAGMRVDAVQRLAEMRQFSPEMAQKVALVLHHRMDALGSNGRRNYAGYKAVAEMLNRVEQTASKGILEAIEGKDPKVAIAIRTLMFTFEDLLTVPEASIREIVSACDKRVLGTALKGSRDNIRAHLFRAMSSRAAEMMRDDMESMGPVRSKDVSAAQQEILALAGKLEAEGRVVLRMGQDDELAI